MPPLPTTKRTEAGRTSASGPFRFHAPRRRATPTPRRRGFSLLELVLVMAIIATAAAIVGPRYASAVSRYRVESAARRVQADLETVRTRARASSRTWTVEFDAIADVYDIYDGTLIAAASEVSTVALADPPYQAEIYGTSFSPKPAAEFNGFGEPLQAGIVVVEAGGYFQTITVKATGRVTRSVLLGAAPPLVPPPP